MPAQPPPLLSSLNAQHLAQAAAASGLTIQELHDLQRHAVAAKATAYCPYSNFRVGAAALAPAAGGGAGGTFVPGANVENAAYPVGACAERVALARAVTEGHRRFRALAVATDISPPASPCGMCRQFIREFCDLQMPVLMFDKDGNFCMLKLEELLPMSFGPEHLDSSRDFAKHSGTSLT